MKNKTKYEMAKEMFFACTEGNRTAENYAEGMYFIESIAKLHYFSDIYIAYNRWINKVHSAYFAMHTLVNNLKAYNLCGEKKYNELKEILYAVAR